VLVVLACALVRLPIEPFLDGKVPYLFFSPAVIVAAWYGGFAPGLVATALSGLLSHLFLLASSSAVAVLTATDALGLTAFWATGAIICLLVEIARRGRARAALREQQLRSTLASLGDAVMVADVAGRITWMNAVAEKLTGWTAAEALGHPLTDVFRVLDEITRTPASNPVDRALREGIAVGLANHAVLVTKEGHDRPIDDSAAPVRGPDGAMSGVVLVFRDITKQRAAEREHAHLAAIIESTLDAVFLKSLHGTILSWNPGAERLYGYTPLEVLGKHVSMLAPPDRATEVDEILQRLRRGERVEHFETVRLRKDGTERDVSLVISPVYDEAGNIFAASTIARDVTDRRSADRKAAIEREVLLAREQAARRQAESASRLKDEFLATVSHELRTPLNAVLGWSRLLAAGTLDPDAARRALTAIERNARVQSELIDDLLDMSRIMSGRLRIETDPIDLAAVVDAALDVVRPGAEAKELQLGREIAGSNVFVRGDANRLQQVVWNLLTNAVKFTPRGGHVQVRLERTGSNAQIVVQDTGQGIPPEFLPHVFDMFRQADSTTTRTQGGLGLGLAIVKHLTALHGGTVHVESAGQDRGATFTVRLPLLNVAPGVATTAGETESVSPPLGLDEQHLPGISVLVVDDEQDTIALVTAVLTASGASVRSATTSVDALAMIDGWRPDVLISDIGMRDDDGYALIRELRSRPPEQGGSIPAIALTGFARWEDQTRSVAAGFQVYLAKPADPSELVRAVQRLTRRRMNLPEPG
jgi:PAS domain S-box-containing protein